jgi:hypothetical protein
MQAQPSSHPIATTIQWRFAVQKLNGISYLYFLTLHPSDTGSAALIKLRASYRCLKTAPPYAIWDRDAIFWRPVLYVATISEVSTSSHQLLYRMIKKTDSTTAQHHGPRSPTRASLYRSRGKDTRYRTHSRFQKPCASVRRRGLSRHERTIRKFIPGLQSEEQKSNLNRKGIEVAGYLCPCCYGNGSLCWCWSGSGVLDGECGCGDQRFVGVGDDFNLCRGVRFLGL